MRVAIRAALVALLIFGAQASITHAQSGPQATVQNPVWDSTGHWYSPCQTCAGGYDPTTGEAIAHCVDPSNGQWGTEGCSVSCNGAGDFGTCKCTASGRGCLYVSVNG